MPMSWRRRRHWRRGSWTVVLDDELGAVRIRMRCCLNLEGNSQRHLKTLTNFNIEFTFGFVVMKRLLGPGRNGWAVGSGRCRISNGRFARGRGGRRNQHHRSSSAQFSVCCDGSSAHCTKKDHAVISNELVFTTRCAETDPNLLAVWSCSCPWFLLSQPMQQPRKSPALIRLWLSNSGYHRSVQSRLPVMKGSDLERRGFYPDKQTRSTPSALSKHCPT